MGLFHTANLAESPKKNVFTNSHGVDEAEFLIDNAQSHTQRINRRCPFNDPTIKFHGSAVLTVYTG